MTKDHPLTYRPDIDGLRAIAVLLVVAFHYYPHWIEGSKFIQGGFIGVDIFFVISGFLITSIIYKEIVSKTFSLQLFYIRRIRRIFPALLIMLTCVLLFGWYVFLPDEFSALSKHIMGGIGFSSNFILWNEVGYFDDSADTKPLLHLWSLGIEEQFYIIWPALLLFLINKRFFFSISIIFLISFLLNILLAQTSPTLIFYSTFTRAWELIMGGIASLLYYKIPQNITNNKKHFINLFPIIGLFIIIIGVIYLNGKNIYPYYYALIPTIGTTLIIIGNKEAFINKYLLSNKYLVYIGLISFPLYLWHWPLLVLYKTSFDLDAVTLTSRFILLIFSFVLASITYHLFELPIRKFGTKAVKYLVLYSLVLATIACLSYKGIVSPRLNGDQINKVLSSKTDWVFPGNQFTSEFSNGLRYYTATRGKDITLYIGDSNLEQYSSRVNLLLKGNITGLNSVIFIGNQRNCATLEFVLADDKLNSACKASLQKLLDLANDVAVKNVVIAAQWNNYYKFLKEINHSSHSIEKLFRHKNIYFVLTMPTGSALDPNSMFRGSRFTSLSMENINNFNLEAFRDTTKDVHRDIAQIAMKLNAKVIDPILFLCADGQCPTTDTHGTPLYKDSKHMTSSYARDNAIFIDETLFSNK
jgi:peptidoglycan/LPS O-acetylase OafA/YrhL